MEIAFGVLHFSSQHFWTMTPIEFGMALRGYQEKQGITASNGLPVRKKELIQLMGQFPD